MNKSWNYKKIGDVCIVERGGSPRPINKFITNSKDGVNWIKIGDTTESMYITQAAQKIIPEGVKKSRYVKSGDFLLSNSMSFGRPYILKIDGCIHDGWLVLRDKDNIFDKRFLYFYLSSKTTYQKFKSMAVGGVVNNLNSEMVKKIEVPTPTIREQQKIVSTLDLLQSIITHRRTQLEKLDLLVKARFVEMFGDVISNNMNWDSKPMSEVAPSKSYKESLEGNVWLLNLDMIEAQTGRIIDYLYVDKSEVGNSTSAFDEGNVLYSKLRPYLNKVVVPKQKGYATTELVPLRPNDLLNREFLAHLLRSDSFVSYINEKVAGAKMPRVSMDIFREFKCILPPLDLQTQFADFVKQVDKSKVAVQKELDKAQMLFDSLMQEYFG